MAVRCMRFREVICCKQNTKDCDEVSEYTAELKKGVVQVPHNLKINFQYNGIYEILLWLKSNALNSHT